MLADSPRVPADSSPVAANADPGFPFAHLVAYVKRSLAEGKPNIYRTTIQEVDRHVLHEVMAFFKGNQLQAAERMGEFLA